MNEKILTVSLPGRSYHIEMERGLLSRTGERCRAILPSAKRLFVVTDVCVASLYGSQVEDSLKAAGFQVRTKVIPAGEESKNAWQLAELWEEMMAFGLTRTDAVIALGGGVVGDLAGFAAATILRGAGFVQIPTTLLAQVDASVGVLIDPECLRTLSDRAFSDGMAEVIKYGCICDAGFFRLLDQYGGRTGVMEHIDQVIYTCCDIKRKLVLSDERDTGQRMILNFGHTIGHAFELAGRFETWTHGQSVAAGMNWAAQLGVKLGVTPPDVVASVQKVLKRYGLPLDLPCPWETLVEAVGLDKKNSGEDIYLIVLEELGRAVRRKLPRNELLGLLQILLHGR